MTSITKPARARLKRIAASVALWLCLTLPSVYVVEKFLGTTGLVIYLILVVFAVVLLPYLGFQVNERRARWLAVVLFVLLIVVFVIVFPHRQHASGSRRKRC